MNFDRVAEIYDATRGLPPEVSRQVAEGIAQAVGARPGTRFLELGVGTGRIALPLAELGYPYTGVDISDQMMARLREKAAGRNVDLTLVEADVTDLPFPDASFDVVLAAHVLHLVPEWQKALGEARRVLVPSGFFVLGGNQYCADAPGGALREQWHIFAREEGTHLLPSYGSPELVAAELTEQGCYSAVYRVAQWQSELRPAELLELQRRRTFSRSWSLTDEELERVCGRMEAWAKERYGVLDQPLESWDEFHVSVSRWPQG